MTQFPSINEQLTLAVVIPLHLFAGKGAGQGREKTAKLSLMK